VPTFSVDVRYISGYNLYYLNAYRWGSHGSALPSYRRRPHSESDGYHADDGADDEAHAKFVAIRWAANDGAPFCPLCGSVENYAYTTRRIWKCKGCAHQFSVTSGTIFASRKLPIRDYLAAIAILVNAVKGISALQLGRDLDVQYKTAFVLAHKLREAIGAEQVQGELSGTVEVDGAYFGGHTKPENKKAERPDLRLTVPAKRQSVVVARERGGKTLPIVVAKEADAVPFIRSRVGVGFGCPC